MQESPSAPYAINFAIMFAYNGSEYDGLERYVTVGGNARSKGPKSIESILLSVVGATVGQTVDSSANISVRSIKVLCKDDEYK